MLDPQSRFPVSGSGPATEARPRALILLRGIGFPFNSNHSYSNTTKEN